MSNATDSQYEQFKSDLCTSAKRRAGWSPGEWLHETFNGLANEMETEYGTTDAQIKSGIQTLREAAKKVRSEDFNEAISLGPALSSPSFADDILGSAATIARNGTAGLKADVRRRQ